MKPSRPQSFQVGPYVVREDAGAPKGADGQRVARVFSRSVAIFNGTLIDALAYAERKRDEYALTVKCPLCSSRPGTRCYNKQGAMAVPHVARVDARERFDRQDDETFALENR